MENQKVINQEIREFLESKNITLEQLVDAAISIAKERGRIPPRTASPSALEMLKRIQAVEPGWDSWQFPTEIYLKAHDLGIAGL